MGEQTQFEPGDKAPNDGEYIEIGERAIHMGVTDPKKIFLNKGETFPETSNKDRKWRRLNHYH